MSYKPPYCTCVETAMKQARQLADDYAWNGEEAMYQRMIKRYKHYKALHDAGELWEPNW